MLFNSTIFIMVFLPIALIGWYLLQKMENPVYGRVFLVGMSMWFYGYYNVYYLWILLVSLAVNYFFSFLFTRVNSPGARKGVLIGGIAANLGLLFYFKYLNFFIDNCNYFLHTSIEIEQIALPLGISFFTFQQLSYVIERYKDSVKHYELVEYACFITFFPQLIAGPIVLHSEFLPQLEARKNRRLTATALWDGFSLFILGLAKKVLLADMLAIIVNGQYANIALLDAPSAWFTIICYMLELYFDFSGYCDMARGIGKMFGFEFPDNFNSPLLSVSVKDFWRRWHITLSRFFTSYIYIPLGGNRKGKWRQCLNLSVVFLASGFWHGANWTFVVWGIMHGAVMVFETIFPNLRFKAKQLNQLVTGIFVTLSFSIFRSDSLADAALLWNRLFMGGFTGRIFEVCKEFQIPEIYVLREVIERVAPQFMSAFYVVVVTILVGCAIVLVRGRRAEVWLADKGRSNRGLFVLATLFTWSVISLSQVSTFLYFNF